ncbi:hypothetical protein P7K49_010393 [Saguinus oedipus]|uniref:Uncharacterized protein n=1 Tax=Saguinus oedipus TaxID=9490 RepID=A0ABQ9VR02_SAGOE|nr:hypothetical protein P7K49_010393 [Saguinus oedipus]
MDEDVDKLYRKAPMDKKGNFNSIEFAHILKHGAKDKDDGSETCLSKMGLYRVRVSTGASLCAGSCNQVQLWLVGQHGEAALGERLRPARGKVSSQRNLARRAAPLAPSQSNPGRGGRRAPGGIGRIPPPRAHALRSQRTETAGMGTLGISRAPATYPPAPDRPLPLNLLSAAPRTPTPLLRASEKAARREPERERKNAHRAGGPATPRPVGLPQGLSGARGRRGVGQREWLLATPSYTALTSPGRGSGFPAPSPALGTASDHGEEEVKEGAHLSTCRPPVPSEPKAPRKRVGVEVAGFSRVPSPQAPAGLSLCCRPQVTEVKVEVPEYLGPLLFVKLRKRHFIQDDAWFCNWISVQGPGAAGDEVRFPCYRWVEGDGVLSLPEGTGRTVLDDPQGLFRKLREEELEERRKLYR